MHCTKKSNFYTKKFTCESINKRTMKQCILGEAPAIRMGNLVICFITQKIKAKMFVKIFGFYFLGKLGINFRTK